MPLEAVDIRISYFHDASDEHLYLLGVDRARLPSPEAWRASYVEDYARPMPERQSYSLLWELGGRVVGFSSADRIVFGDQAFLHLHILDEAERGRGFGADFVRRSASMYFDALRLDRLFCEPNALNPAPNRTVQRAGFRYVFSHQTTPGPLAFPQVVTRWVLESPG
jgi:RimJ/RimL family protein N-acetyltransferase